MLFRVGKEENSKKTPFKFCNFGANHEDFLPLVEQIWNTEVKGSPMFILVSNLKAFKVELKKLNKR